MARLRNNHLFAQIPKLLRWQRAPRGRRAWPAAPFFVGYAALALGLSACYQTVARAPTSALEGAANQKNNPDNQSFYDNPDHLQYYVQLNERERARDANLTAKLAYEDVEASYTINLIRIGIMFFMTLCLFFTILNLDVFEDMFSPAQKYRSNIYSSQYDR